MNKLEVLRECELFKELDDEQLKLMEEMCISKVYEPGELLCKQGKSTDKFYVIQEGLVVILLETGLLSHHQVQAASSYDMVGWSSMSGPKVPCTATAQAMEKTTVLVFDSKQVTDACTADALLGRKICTGIARTLAERLRSAFTQLMGVTAQD